MPTIHINILYFRNNVKSFHYTACSTPDTLYLYFNNELIPIKQLKHDTITYNLNNLIQIHK